MLKLSFPVTPRWEGALWVCFETAIASILVITPSCPFGGWAMNVLLLLMLVEPDGHWAVMADCPPHLSVQFDQDSTPVFTFPFLGLSLCSQQIQGLLGSEN